MPPLDFASRFVFQTQTKEPHCFVLGKNRNGPTILSAISPFFGKERWGGLVCFWVLGLEGAFGQLEDGGLFEDVVGGGRVQKFQFAGLNESGVSKRGTERLDCRSGGNRWVVGGGQFCRWIGEDSIVEGAGGG